MEGNLHSFARCLPPIYHRYKNIMPMNKQLLRKIHLYLSIPLGIFITLICLSGATLVFKNEIRDALGMPKVIAHHNHAKKGTSDKKTAKMKPAGGKAHSGKALTEGHKTKPTADAPHGTTSKRDFFSYVTRFHTSLMMGSGGRLFVTIVTILFALVLLTGIMICWPKGSRQWRQRLSVERKKGIRRLMYDLHVSLGFWALLWILMLAITGAAFGLHLLPRGTETIKLFHALHVGSWGGMTTKIITFIASLIGASLPITGYYLYFKKRGGKKH